MKGSKFFLALAVLVSAVFATSAFAQTSANTTASANANIIPAISIARVADLNFGDILQPAGAGGTLSLTAAAPTVPSAVGVTTAGGTVNAAEFTVMGAGTRSFSVTLPASINITSGTNSMVVNNFTSSCAPCTFGGAPATMASLPLYVGATLNVGNTQALGAYTGNFSVTVAYQ